MISPAMRYHIKSRGELDTLLHAATDAGTVQEVDDLLTAGAAVNCFRDGVTAAGRAVRAGNTGILGVILRHKPNLHLGLCHFDGGTDTSTDMGTHTRTTGHHSTGQPTTQPKTQRHTECRVPLLLMAAETGNADIVRLLLQHGADPNEAEDVHHHSALHMAAAGGHEAVVRALLQYEAYVNRLDVCSKTALHHAALRGDVGVTWLLLQDGAGVNMPGEDDVFPLHAAARDRDKDMVGLLLEHGALVYLQDRCGHTALHHAANAGSADITRLLLEAGGGGADWRTDRGETALGAACEAGHVEVVRTLLESRQVHPDNGAGRGAAYRLPLQIAAAKGSVEIIRLLLHHGANINQRDPIHGETGLHWAVRHHQMAAILELLQNKAKVNIADSVSRQTALHLACRLDSHGTFLDAARLLVAHGGNIHLTQRRTRDTPLHIAARNGGTELVEELMKQTTISHSLNAQNVQGETPLMVAARGGHCDIMDTLMHAGSQLLLTSLPGEDTALHMAIRNRCYTAAFSLIRHGCDVNTENASGQMLLGLLVDLIADGGYEDTELVNLVSSMVCVGARCGGKQDVIKSVIKQIIHTEDFDVSHTSHSNSVKHNHVLSAAMLACLQPLPLYSGCVAAVRRTLVHRSGGVSILPRITALPVPGLIKHNLALGYRDRTNSGS